MDELAWDPHDVLVTIDHPFGTLEKTLHQWMLEGPGLRRYVRPVAARSRRTGEALPLAVIPVAYRNDTRSRALIEAGELESPWPSPPAVGHFLLPDFERYHALLDAKYLSHETVAACGRLITATARLSGLLLSHGDWETFVGDARRVLKGFDEAWARYEQELAQYRPRRADLRLRTAILDALEGIDGLIACFPVTGEAGLGTGDQ